MGSTTNSGHSAAVRRAHQAAARRIEALHEQEAAITAALVGYFEAKDRADTIRADAQARAARLLQAAEEKAARLIEQAEKDAADPDAQVGKAIRHLRELGETTASVASMTNLSQAVVRAVEHEHLAPRDPAPRKQPAAPASNSRARSGAVPE